MKAQKAAEEAAKAAGEVPKDLSPEALEKLVKGMKMQQPVPSPPPSSSAP